MPYSRELKFVRQGTLAVYVSKYKDALGNQWHISLTATPAAARALRSKNKIMCIAEPIEKAEADTELAHVRVELEKFIQEVPKNPNAFNLPSVPTRKLRLSMPKRVIASPYRIKVRVDPPVVKTGILTMDQPHDGCSIEVGGFSFGHIYISSVLGSLTATVDGVGALSVPETGERVSFPVVSNGQPWKVSVALVAGAPTYVIEKEIFVL